MDIAALEKAWAEITPIVEMFGKLADVCGSVEMREEAGVYISEKLIGLIKDIIADENAPSLVKTSIAMAGK